MKQQLKFMQMRVQLCPTQDLRTADKRFFSRTSAEHFDWFTSLCGQRLSSQAGSNAVELTISLTRSHWIEACQLQASDWIVWFLSLQDPKRARDLFKTNPFKKDDVRRNKIKQGTNSWDRHTQSLWGQNQHEGFLQPGAPRSHRAILNSHSLHSLATL